MTIKSLLVTAVLATAILCSGGVVSATDNSALIAQLQAQIATLMAQLQALQTQQGTPQTWCHTFNTSLGYANSGSSEVAHLHTVLQKENISYGQDSVNEYGEDTMSAVIQLQTKYGITQTGYFGSATRARMNLLHGCGPVNAPVCTSINYSSPSVCSPDGTFYRTIISALPIGCNTSDAVLSGPCTPLSTQPSITIISPNGGETYQNNGSTIVVRWTTNNVSSTFNFDVIRLRGYPNGGEYNLTNYSILNDGQEIIAIPANVPAGNYTLEIKGYLGSVLVMDSSNNYFSITSGDGQNYPIETLSIPQVNGYYVSQNGVAYAVSGQLDYSWCATANSTASGIGPFEFNWGDGAVSCSWFPGMHTYSASGNYQIVVKVKDTTGRISSRTNSVTVVAPVTQPSITSITPTQGLSGTTVTIYGTNLSGTSVVEFYAAGSQLMGTLAPSYVSSQYITFTISSIFAGNMTPGLYQVGVVTNACAGGCDSNRIGFTLTAPIIAPSITINSSGVTDWQPGLSYGIPIITYGVTSVKARLSSVTGNRVYDAPSYTVNQNGNDNLVITVPSDFPAGDAKLYVFDSNNLNIYGVFSGYINIIAIPVPVNGTCGSANGQVLTTAPTTNICSTGTVSAVNASIGSNVISFSWSCGGLNGGTTANCSASANVVNALCGTAAKAYGPTDTTFSGSMCLAGTPSGTPNFPAVGSSSIWTCYGYGGTNVTCTATRTSSAQPSITVTSPNGGEQWAQGSTHSITWDASGLSANNSVYIAAVNGSAINLLNAEGTPVLQGQYSWTIPSSYQTGSTYKIYVYTDFQPSTDDSNNYFSIVAPAVSSNVSQSSLASLSDALAKLVAQVQAMLKK